MIRSMIVLILVCVLSAAPNASAACRRAGTQLECDLGASRVVIGTQAAAPTYSTSLRPEPLHGPDQLVDGRPAPALPFELKLQTIEADPSLCRTIGNETFGNETYCN